jgi:hypothetical protein
LGIINFKALGQREDKGNMEVGQKLQELKLSDDAKIVERADPNKPPESGENAMEVEGSDSVSPELVSRHNGPIVILMLGLAGAGKTSLTQRLTASLLTLRKRPYLVNLDPACHDPPFPVRIDIRDTLDFQLVKSQYNLGPNGGIVTALNLFATRFNDVMEILQSRASSYDYILIDTPGQIEVFMWSASGQIIMQSLGAVFPTVIAYVTDLKLSANPITFMSNMTYASSIIYKSRLPMVLALNKADQINPDYAKEWILDFEAFQAAVRDLEGYSANLASSISLAMDEMYGVLDHVAISAYNGSGINDFLTAVHKAADEYEVVFRPYFEKLKKQAMKQAQKKNQKKGTASAVAAAGGEPSVFSISGSTDAGLGLHLGLEEDDDDDTSSEEDEQEMEDPEELNFQQMMQDESRKRVDKAKAAEASGGPAP